MVMNEVAEGLLARLSFMKRKLNFKASCPQCLNNNDWAKLRSKLESTFAELGSTDMSKQPHYDDFLNSAGMTMTELHNFYSTFVDIYELHVASHEAILTIASAFRTLKVGSPYLFTRTRPRHTRRRRPEALTAPCLPSDLLATRR